MRRLITRMTQMYVCLLETKLPQLVFPEHSHGAVLLPQETLLPGTLDLSVSQSPLLRTTHNLSLPPVADHFIHNSLCIPMLHPTAPIDLPVRHTNTSVGLSFSRPPLELPPLSSDRIIRPNMYDFFLDDSSMDEM